MNKMKELDLNGKVKKDLFILQEQSRFVKKVNNLIEQFDCHIKREVRLNWIIGSLLLFCFLEAAFVLILFLSSC